MSDIDVVTVGDWALALFDHESERRVLDVELAERLGLAKARDIRELIKRHTVDLSKFGEVAMRRAVRRIEIGPKNARRFRDDTVNEYWLNKDQALYIALKSDTAKANEISVALVLAFRELERRVIAESSKFSRQELIFDRMLLEEHVDRKTLWTKDVPRELSRIYVWDLSKVKGYPSWMGNITANIYDLIVGKEVMDEARARRNKAMKRNADEDDGLGGRTMLYQWFREETRRHFEQKIPIVIALIRTSSSVDDFWNRMELEFGQSMLQLQIAFAAEGCCARCGVPLDPNSRFCNQCGARVMGRLST